MWQSPLLPVHLIIPALMVGSGALLVVGLFISLPAGMNDMLTILFATVLVIDLFVTLVGEFSIPHASEIAAKAAHEISHGRYRRHFWGGSIIVGHLLPLVLLLIAWPLDAAGPAVLAIAALAAVAGLYLYEYAFVMAPQEIPNS